MKRVLASMLAVAMLSGSGLAFADPPPHAGGHGNAHGDKGKGPPPGQVKRWQKGDRLPRDHRGVYVSDYARYGLKPPPPGHQWRRVDNDYVLVAVATGIIASVILGDH
ncbi:MULTISPECIES: RcnB family protein [Gammaproteobacteria]|jgi:Ni/Co efflux regulator RcnB|uniref:Regulator RcnB of Ni and Co efflux n=1 Tax=Xanthomonas boreopolis TaxID=86183 RepID=A0A919F601_9XANT|nr:RcnB family protein [Pseudomonas sp. Hp2]GHH48582.1 hypothetical protein GCM10009090_06740 [[Pseudomonas] boreopolis]